MCEKCVDYGNRAMKNEQSRLIVLEGSEAETLVCLDQLVGLVMQLPLMNVAGLKERLTTSMRSVPLKVARDNHIASRAILQPGTKPPVTHFLLREDAAFWKNVTELLEKLNDDLITLHDIKVAERLPAPANENSASAAPLTPDEN